MSSDKAADQGRVIAALHAEIDRATSGEAMLARLRVVASEALHREIDQPLRRQVMAALDRLKSSRPDGWERATPEQLGGLRTFCKEVAALVAPRCDLSPAEAEVEQVALECEVVPPPFPSRHDQLADLLPAALAFRMEGVLGFFHRRNPRVRRAEPPPYLLSPVFAERFITALVEQLAPRLLAQPRFRSLFEDGRSWKRTSTAEFWEMVEADATMADRLDATWAAIWDELRPQRKTGKMGKPVQVPPPALVNLRAALAPPVPDAYDLPRIGNAEIDLLASLLTKVGRAELDHAWDLLSQVYEQEWDRRFVQHRPRAGALCDALLDMLQTLPQGLGEFMILLCYFDFPKLDLAFVRSIDNDSAGTPILARFLGLEDGEGA